MITKALLQCAIDRIRDHWTQGAYARNWEGRSVEVKDGVRFCMVGAVVVCGGDEDAFDTIWHKVHGPEPGPLAYNDSFLMTEKQIVQALEELKAVAA